MSTAPIRGGSPFSASIRVRTAEMPAPLQALRMARQTRQASAPYQTHGS